MVRPAVMVRFWARDPEEVLDVDVDPEEVLDVDVAAFLEVAGGLVLVEVAAAVFF